MIRGHHRLGLVCLQCKYQVNPTIDEKFLTDLKSTYTGMKIYMYLVNQQDHESDEYMFQ